MKRLVLISLLLLSAVACKKKEYSPVGPTDVRIRNISDMAFQGVIVRTSENSADIDTILNIASDSVSDYCRFTKAYPKAEISAEINIDGSLVKFSTGTVNYTYMEYLGRNRITYEVYISNMDTHELTISNVIFDEALVLK